MTGGVYVRTPDQGLFQGAFAAGWLGGGKSRLKQ